MIKISLTKIIFAHSDHVNILEFDIAMIFAQYDPSSTRFEETQYGQMSRQHTTSIKLVGVRNIDEILGVLHTLSVLRTMKLIHSASGTNAGGCVA